MNPFHQIDERHWWAEYYRKDGRVVILDRKHAIPREEAAIAKEPTEEICEVETLQENKKEK